MLATWELDRAREPALRTVCAACHLLSAEHPEPWMVCRGSWVHVAWETRLRFEFLLPHVLRGLFGWKGKGSA